jgi:hypothetical protein
MNYLGQSFEVCTVAVIELAWRNLKLRVATDTYKGHIVFGLSARAVRVQFLHDFLARGYNFSMTFWLEGENETGLVNSDPVPKGLHLQQ